MRETWYVLEDGRTVCPSEVTTADNGRLQHKSGAFVAMKGDVPHSRGVDLDEERAKAKPEPVAVKDVKPEQPTGGYKTRETKAR